MVFLRDEALVTETSYCKRKVLIKTTKKYHREKNIMSQKFLFRKQISQRYKFLSEFPSVKHISVTEKWVSVTEKKFLCHIFLFCHREKVLSEKKAYVTKES